MINEFIVPMKTLRNRERKIRVYLPDTYDNSKKYPVIYMHDGQNLFIDTEATYGKSWNIAENFSNMGLEYIVVGIDSGKDLERLDELSPWLNEWITEDLDLGIKRPCGGDGDKYLAFITDELKPLIDAKYSTLKDREHTCISGSSMGGLESLYAVLKRPDIFSKGSLLSSAFWFAEPQILELIRNYKKDYELSVYLDFGTNESKKLEENEYLLAFQKVVLHHLRNKNIRTKFYIHEGGVHNEASWEKTFPSSIIWLFEGIK